MFECYNFKSITAEHIFTAFTRAPNSSLQIKTSTSKSVKDSNYFGYFTHAAQNTTISQTSKNVEGGNGNQKDEDICGHIVTTYILPSLMHLIAYILGFVYFRVTENEQLYALMEKVFLAVNQKYNVDSQEKVIKRLK